MSNIDQEAIINGMLKKANRPTSEELIIRPHLALMISAIHSKDSKIQDGMYKVFSSASKLPPSSIAILDSISKPGYFKGTMDDSSLSLFENYNRIAWPAVVKSNPKGLSAIYDQTKAIPSGSVMASTLPAVPANISVDYNKYLDRYGAILSNVNLATRNSQLVKFAEDVSKINTPALKTALTKALSADFSSVSNIANSVSQFVLRPALLAEAAFGSVSSIMNTILNGDKIAIELLTNILKSIGADISAVVSDLFSELNGILGTVNSITRLASRVVTRTSEVATVPKTKFSSSPVLDVDSENVDQMSRCSVHSENLPDDFFGAYDRNVSYLNLLRGFSAKVVLRGDLRNRIKLLQSVLLKDVSTEGVTEETSTGLWIIGKIGIVYADQSVCTVVTMYKDSLNEVKS